jgi:hypothetical protein
MAGYSQKSLVKKLGLKAGFKAFVFNAPEDYFSLLGLLPENVLFLTKLKPSLDFIHYFSRSRQKYFTDISRLKKAFAPQGMIWVFWPKLSSGVQSDLTEKDTREIALREGLVDIKVCAVDEIWSGLKFVVPVKLRLKKEKPE